MQRIAVLLLLSLLVTHGFAGDSLAVKSRALKLKKERTSLLSNSIDQKRSKTKLSLRLKETRLATRDKHVEGESSWQSRLLRPLKLVLGASQLLLRRSWWSLPMGLAFVPLYSHFIRNVPAHMPTWWPLTNIAQMKYAKAVVGIFLGSNVSYLISATYLMIRFSGWRKKESIKPYPLLGIFVLLSGIVSTVFHFHQAWGAFHVAEGLCYIDHAVAISSILYFWHKCGRPGLVTSILSGFGLATLAITGPAYAWLHSSWHFLSAAAAMTWAHDGLDRQRKAIAIEATE